jgi:DNA transformation protein and related proteins
MAAPSKRSTNGKSPRTKRPGDDFAAFICEQLADLPDLKCRAMFGGHGLYAGDQFFGIVWRGGLYFKTSPETRGEYLAADMGWFQPNEKQALKNYYEVPARVIERRAELLAWARRAVTA